MPAKRDSVLDLRSNPDQDDDTMDYNDNCLERIIYTLTVDP